LSTDRRQLSGENQLHQVQNESNEDDERPGLNSSGREIQRKIKAALTADVSAMLFYTLNFKSNRT
jgi:hypothetical protein